VLLATDRNCGNIIEASGILDCGLQGFKPSVWVDLGSGWVRGATRANKFARVGITDDYFATLSRRVDSSDQWHG
jgi:hypothetical protein